MKKERQTQTYGEGETGRQTYGEREKKRSVKTGGGGKRGRA